jgi:hypothetical protein
MTYRMTDLVLALLIRERTTNGPKVTQPYTDDCGSGSVSL